MTLSQMQLTTARSWDTKTADMCRSRQMSESSLSTCAWDDTSRALVTSSHSRIFGSTATARAIAKRWHWPPLRLRG